MGSIEIIPLGTDNTVEHFTADGKSFEETYAPVAAELIRLSRTRDVVHTVMGGPAIAGQMCALIDKAKQKEQMPFDITPIVDVMSSLRGPQGCPWDKAQTHRSLRRYLLEEVYEMLDAIDNDDNEGICEELGDILYQIVIHARIGEEKGLFSAQNIVTSITKKMIRRHPHVFGEKRLENTGLSMVNWDRLKQGEHRQQHKHLLDGVVKGLPSLLQSYKLQEKSAKVGFEWKHTEDVWNKFCEEWQEFIEAVSERDEVHMEEEAGDVLFVFANLCRRYHIEPECALHRANSKFRRRFSYVEDCVRRSSRQWQDFTLDELNVFWQEAKEQERHEPHSSAVDAVSRKL
ncbi:MAG: nucleoside triphosphate pyrophosphohydrolase [Megasphaera sp.]|jgi:tetrapyrrole methylase family protein/MazG family protein|nr:nucleoside triphosphate pyrophosphohydrolase [Megasphaera sp.]MCI1247463.1 nucleoside triphosphate pyrophosphohydrolase [Megasphaera sp.]